MSDPLLIVRTIITFVAVIGFALLYIKYRKLTCLMMELYSFLVLLTRYITISNPIQAVAIDILLTVSASLLPIIGLTYHYETQHEKKQLIKERDRLLKQ